MADTYTASYTFTLIEINSSQNTWGTKLNANWTRLDQILNGDLPIAPNMERDGWAIDGTAITLTGQELNRLYSVTSNVQGQLNALDARITALETP